MPVKLYSAVQDQTVRFHILDEKTKTRVKQHMIDAESGEVVETPGRVDCAQGLPDVCLYVGTGRQPSVTCVENLACKPDDRSDTASGRADRERRVELRRLAVPGPADRLAATHSADGGWLDPRWPPPSRYSNS